MYIFVKGLVQWGILHGVGLARVSIFNMLVWNLSPPRGLDPAERIKNVHQVFAWNQC